MAGVAQRRQYADGEFIHMRGDNPATMGLVISGHIRIGRVNADGSQIYVGKLGPGQHYGDAAHISGSKRLHDAVAVGAVEIDHFDAEAFERLLGNPEVLLALYKVTANSLTGAMAMSDDLRSMKPEAHLAKILLQQSARNNDAGIIKILQEELAAILGVSTMTLGKAISKLRKLGLIETGYGKIRIIDRATMREWLAQCS